MILCLFCSAQQLDTTTFEGKSKYIFQHVDKSQIGTGLLAEYGAELLPFANYNGTLMADSNFVGLVEWRQLYGSLFTAQINTNSNLLRLDTINNRIANLAGLSNPINFAVLHYNYQGLREDAVSANLFTVNNDQLFDVPSRTQSPYTNNTLFAVAPIRQVATVGDNSIIFRPELFLAIRAKPLR